MGNRLSKIYTRTGDDGTTGLGDGARIAKYDLRMQAIGDVDETNCAVGLLVAELPAADPLQPWLSRIQHRLFDLGGELCLPEYELIKAEHTAELENWLDELNDTLPPLKNFILPGGSKAAAFCHQARAVCRRAERTIAQLAAPDANTKLPGIRPTLTAYINRLSDFLFVAARVIARRDGGSEVLWVQGQ
ncbi:cob(I)yrinic acid a,c-diamide adenosyltransferase [Simiduia sp. 21SJ11W-1]|uniref:cob(I)yrinic acid a,c-diamide adenosyltransferase n=1 Tax=Simiduia sp. 21SJ11W-1 TaxID=2909669 RepID=UPI0020A14B1B|nr:cob(I)yrinic acid a,c-diamide adenosyltransferase [Simiduia sp. 21SJ11W-1]UTA47091.1 cob(I)yrinic acid a,c-diamide adenosyltransferase [Simiduia sp. 21SJ11W-1]